MTEIRPASWLDYSLPAIEDAVNIAVTKMMERSGHAPTHVLLHEDDHAALVRGLRVPTVDPGRSFTLATPAGMVTVLCGGSPRSVIRLLRLAK